MIKKHTINKNPIITILDKLMCKLPLKILMEFLKKYKLNSQKVNVKDNVTILTVYLEKRIELFFRWVRALDKINRIIDESNMLNIKRIKHLIFRIYHY